MTVEGVAAPKDAVDALAAQAPLPPLAAWPLPPGLCKAAQDHTADLGPKGATGHTGSDGSSTSERVLRHCQWKETVGENLSFGEGTARGIVRQLFVDDAVPDRGHRKNILNPEFKCVGIAVGPHNLYNVMCCQVFAGGVGPKAVPIATDGGGPVVVGGLTPVPGGDLGALGAGVAALLAALPMDQLKDLVAGVLVGADADAAASVEITLDQAGAALTIKRSYEDGRVATNQAKWGTAG